MFNEQQAAAHYDRAILDWGHDQTFDKPPIYRTLPEKCHVCRIDILTFDYEVDRLLSLLDSQQVMTEPQAFLLNHRVDVRREEIRIEKRFDGGHRTNLCHVCEESKEKADTPYFRKLEQDHNARVERLKRNE